MDTAMATLFEQLRLHWRAHFVLSDLLLTLDSVLMYSCCTCAMCDVLEKKD